LEGLQNQPPTVSWGTVKHRTSSVCGLPRRVSFGSGSTCSSSLQRCKPKGCACVRPLVRTFLLPVLCPAKVFSTGDTCAQRPPTQPATDVQRQLQVNEEKEQERHYFILVYSYCPAGYDTTTTRHATAGHAACLASASHVPRFVRPTRGLAATVFGEDATTLEFFF
jgi:hypothetical protein